MVKLSLRWPTSIHRLLPIKPPLPALIACLVVISLICLFAIGKYLSRPPVNDIRETAVTVATVTKGPLESFTSLSGVVEPEAQVTLSAKIGGRVSWVGVEIGDSVEKGAVLLEIDAEEIRAQLQQARGGLDAARANLARLLAGCRPEEIKQAEAQLQQAEANLENARRDFERMKSLYDVGAIAEQQLDGAKLRLAVAESQHEVASQQYALAKAGPTKEMIEAAQAQVTQAEGSVRLFAAQLANARLTSPIDGEVSMVVPKVGELVSPGSPLVTVTNADNLYVTVGVPENLVNLVSTGQTVSVKVSSVSSVPLKGEIANVGPAADPRTKLFPVKIRLLQDNRPSSRTSQEIRVRPGMYAQVLFPENKTEEALLVPAKSIFEIDGSNWVYVVDERTSVAILRRIEVAFTNGETAAVTSGLKEGERVITSGQRYLKDGAKVVIREG